MAAQNQIIVKNNDLFWRRPTSWPQSAIGRTCWNCSKNRHSARPSAARSIDRSHKTSSRSFAQCQRGSRGRGRCQELNVGRLSRIPRDGFGFMLKSRHASATHKTFCRHASIVVHTGGIQRVDGRTPCPASETAVISVDQKRALIDGRGCAGDRFRKWLWRLSQCIFTQHCGDSKTRAKQENAIPTSLPEIHRKRHFHFELSKIRADMKFVPIQCAKQVSVPDSV